MILQVMMIVLLGAGAVQAQNVTIEVQTDPAGLLEASPEAMVKKLRSGPDAFLRDAAKLIYGYGAGEGIDAAGIERFVALERARIRAGATEALLAADLDNDGDVSRAELQVLVDAVAAGRRGRLWLGFGQGDASGDGVLTREELGKFAESRALDELSDEDVLRLRGLLSFDLDGDGITTMAEVGTAVRAILDEA